MVIGFYYYFIYGQLEFRRNTNTPKAFLSTVAYDAKLYAKDSISILAQLKSDLLHRKDFFQNTAYYDSTLILIDTIVYSADYNKLGILILTKNPTYRQLIPEKGYSWYYDATSYLGLKKDGKIILGWLGPSFTNSTDSTEISNNIREVCFRMFMEKKKVGDSAVYYYNFNDSRFWNSAIWAETFERSK